MAEFLLSSKKTNFSRVAGNTFDVKNLSEPFVVPVAIPEVRKKLIVHTAHAESGVIHLRPRYIALRINNYAPGGTDEDNARRSIPKTALHIGHYPIYLAFRKICPRKNRTAESDDISCKWSDASEKPAFRPGCLKRKRRDDHPKADFPRAKRR